MLLMKTPSKVPAPRARAVIDGFIIQGGDPTGTGYRDPSIPTVPDEFTDHNKNDRDTIAMARALWTLNTQFLEK